MGLSPRRPAIFGRQARVAVPRAASSMRFRRAFPALLIASCVTFGAPQASLAGSRLNSVDAAATSAVHLFGAAEPGIGGHVRSVGDVNGDGTNDVVVEAGSTTVAPAAYVVFLDPLSSAIDLSNPLLSGFKVVLPENTWEYSSTLTQLWKFDYAPAGDVNGDGKADILISAQMHNTAGRKDSGAVYVVFGKTTTNSVDLASIGSAGIEIDGREASIYAGEEVDGPGDLNGDGKDDVLISEPDGSTGSNPYSAWVVFGRAAAGTIDLAALGTAGYRLEGAASGVSQVTGVPDMNGDGRPETVVGGGCGGACVGTAYVVWGRTTTDTVNLASLGADGFTLAGIGLGSAAAAGDVNNDGRGDFVVTNVNASLLNDHGGAGYVVFGKSSTAPVDLTALGTAGFAVGGGTDWFMGGDVAGVGDVNGDGFSDVAFGHGEGPNADPVYVVLGGSSPKAVPSLEQMPPSRGYRIDGGGTAIESFDGGRQLVGTSAPDIIVGEPARGWGGQAFILSQMPQPQLSYPAQLVYTRGTSVKPLEASYAYTRESTFEVTPLLPDGLKLDPSTGTVTGTPTTVAGTQQFSIKLTDDGGTVTTPLTIRIDSDDFAVTAPAAGGTVTAIRPTIAWDAAAAPDATDGVDHYDIYVDGLRDRSVPVSACSGSTCSEATTSVLPDGNHTVDVHAIDRTGRDRASTNRTFVVAVPPLAAVTADPNLAVTGDPVTLDASGSIDPNGSIVRYEWDLDGDGTYETDGGASPRIARAYGSLFERGVGVRVTDSGANTATARTALLVAPRAPGGPVGVSMDDGAVYTNDPHVDVAPIWPRFATRMLISNDGGFRKATPQVVTDLVSWLLDVTPSGGPDRYTRVIYVRFSGPGIDETKTFSDDIVLDMKPPVISTAALTTRAASTAKRTRLFRVAVTAKDDRSGVATVQAAASRSAPLSWQKYKKVALVRSARTPAWVRARDRAGNVSRWHRVKVRRSR